MYKYTNTICSCISTGTGICLGIYLGIYIYICNELGEVKVRITQGMNRHNQLMILYDLICSNYMVMYPNPIPCMLRPVNLYRLHTNIEGLPEYTKNTRSYNYDIYRSRPTTDHGRALPTVRIIVPSSCMVSVRPNAINIRTIYGCITLAYRARHDIIVIV